MLALIIPVSKADMHLLPRFVQVCQHLGHFGKHRVIFVPTQEVAQEPEISLAAEHMKDVSDNVAIIPLKFTPQGGWPKACNQHFNAVVPIGSSTGCNWYFCELDTTPMVVDWLNILETELNLSGKNYLGPVVSTRFKEGINGAHMVGSAIYAHDMAKTASLWKFCHGQPAPFDIYHRDELRKRWTESQHMQHMWSTVNYRETEGGLYICDPHPDNPVGSDHSGAVYQTAVVVHGCKDGSLAELVLSKPPVKLEGALTDTKPAQVIHFSGNPQVWRLVSDETAKEQAPQAQQPAQTLADPEEVAPEKHFERLCEALGLFADKNQDILQMLIERIPAPKDELEEEAEEDAAEPEKVPENAPESQETPTPAPQPPPQAVTTPPVPTPEPSKEVPYPSKEQILAQKAGANIRFTDIMDHFGIPRDQTVKFKGHLNDLGFLVAKAGWLTTPEPGKASFAAA
jgi:hypothetical protein